MSAETGPSITSQEEVERVPLHAEGFDDMHLDKTRVLLEDDGYQVLDGSIVWDRKNHGPSGEIDVRPPLRIETQQKILRLLGISTEPIFH